MGTAHQSLVSTIAPGMSLYIPAQDQLDDDMVMPTHVDCENGWCGNWAEVEQQPWFAKMLGTGTLGGMVHVITSVVESVPMIQQATVCHKFGDFGFCHEVDQPMHLYNVTTVDNVNFS